MESLSSQLAGMRFQGSTPTVSTSEGFVTPPTRIDSPQPEVPSPPVPTPDDIIIAVMGITGCGKTTFVNHFADQKLLVGHTLDSCTQCVEIAACTLEDGTVIYLVDTPGFNDSLRSDTEILREVSAWLIRAYNSNYRLAGIIYLHRILDNRVGGVGTRNLKMFRKLCGDKNLGSVVLATTHWDSVDRKKGRQRELELQQEENYWAPLIREGSSVLRHDKNEVSGLKIINHLIDRKNRMTLDIQRELVDKNMRLEQTGAGSELATAVERLLQQYEQKIRNIERELREVLQRDTDARERLEDAKAEWQEKFNKANADARNLKATHEQLLAAERDRHERLLEQERARHNEELRGQKEQLRKDFFKRMHETSCLIM